MAQDSGPGRSHKRADDTDQQPEWVSIRAITWVLDESPCPTELLPALIAIARRCDQNGKGSYQSMPTLAETIGKSEDQARRDVVKLLGLRLILPGDKGLPARHGVPAGKRPAVYDVNLGLRGPKPAKASKNKSGKKKVDITPCTHASPGMEARGGMDATPTPCMDATPTPCMDATQRRPSQDKEKDSLSPSPTVDSPPVPGEPNRERDPEIFQELKSQNPIRRILAKHGCTDTDADKVINYWNRKHGDPKGPGWWRTCDNNGDIPHHITEALTQPASDIGAAPPVPPHPDAHLFQPGRDGITCTKCGLVERNARHRTLAPPQRPSQHRTYRDPVNLDDYNQDL